MPQTFAKHRKRKISQDKDKKFTAGTLFKGPLSYKVESWKRVGVFNEPLIVGKTAVGIQTLPAGLSECDPKGLFSLPFPFFFPSPSSSSHKHTRAPMTNNSLTGSLTSIGIDY